MSDLSDYREFVREGRIAFAAKAARLEKRMRALETALVIATKVLGAYADDGSWGVTPDERFYWRTMGPDDAVIALAEIEETLKHGLEEQPK